MTRLPNGLVTSCAARTRKSRFFYVGRSSTRAVCLRESKRSPAGAALASRTPHRPRTTPLPNPQHCGGAVPGMPGTAPPHSLWSAGRPHRRHTRHVPPGAYSGAGSTETLTPDHKSAQLGPRDFPHKKPKGQQGKLFSFLANLPVEYRTGSTANRKHRKESG